MSRRQKLINTKQRITTLEARLETSDTTDTSSMTTDEKVGHLVDKDIDIAKLNIAKRKYKELLAESAEEAE